MAKLNPSGKVSFGSRKRGKYKKSNGPKDKPTKPYNRQGRWKIPTEKENIYANAVS